MKFKVAFISRGNAFPINTESRNGGLNLLDRARQFVGIPDLSPEFVDDYIGSMREIVVEAEVSEGVARASGLFATCSTARVIVPPHSLEKYLQEEPRLDQGKNGMTVRWKSIIRTDLIVEDWIAAGYPAEWDPNAED